jgi:hypothetical protein
MIQPFQTLRQGLVGAWCPSLGASGLSLIDRSGRNNHGTLTNMGGQDNWRPSGGLCGGVLGLNFDGTNDNVSVPASTALTSVVWCSFWFRLTQTLTPATKRYTLANFCSESVTPFRTSLYVGFNVLGFGPADGTGRLNVLTYDANAGTTTSGAYTTQDFASATNRWYHVSCGWNRSAWRLFIDGVEDTNAQSTQRAATTTPTNVSLIGGTDNRYSPVLLDDIRVWNRPLSQAETRLLATRPGIGLVPQRQRRYYPRTPWINVGGTWKNADMYQNVGGEWKLTVPYVNDGGTWK